MVPIEISSMKSFEVIETNVGNDDISQMNLRKCFEWK